MIKINLAQKIYWTEELLTDKVNRNGQCFAVMLSDEKWLEQFGETISRPILWGFSDENE